MIEKEENNKLDKYNTVLEKVGEIMVKKKKKRRGVRRVKPRLKKRRKR